MLNIMSSWCTKWRLTINSEKTQVHFKKKKLKLNYLRSWFFYIYFINLLLTQFCLMLQGLRTAQSPQQTF